MKVVIMVRKNVFMKSDIARNVDLVIIEVINTISTMMWRVSKKNAMSSPWREFVTVRSKSLSIA